MEKINYLKIQEKINSTKTFEELEAFLTTRKEITLTEPKEDLTKITMQKNFVKPLFAEITILYNTKQMFLNYKLILNNLCLKNCTYDFSQQKTKNKLNEEKIR